MVRTRERQQQIPRLPDSLWAELKPLLPPERPAGRPGRPAVGARQILDGVLYVLCTGCRWKALPREYGSGSTCHRRFQAWLRAGVFQQIWPELLAQYGDLRDARRAPVAAGRLIGVKSLGNLRKVLGGAPRK